MAPPSAVRTVESALEAELLRAVRQSQNTVLRPLALEVGGVGITSRHHAVDRSGLSGDLYDLAHSPYGLRVVIGDVRGHGPEAALLCAATICAFRDGAYTTPALVDLATHLDARINPALSTEDFVTVVLAEFAQGEVRLVNCGHPSPLRVGRRAERLPPRRHSPPLGLNPVPSLQRVRLGVGERLLLYTDGLSEARDAGGRCSPWTKRSGRRCANLCWRTRSMPWWRWSPSTPAACSKTIWPR